MSLRRSIMLAPARRSRSPRPRAGRIPRARLGAEARAPTHLRPQEAGLMERTDRIREARMPRGAASADGRCARARPVGRPARRAVIDVRHPERRPIVRGGVPRRRRPGGLPAGRHGRWRPRRVAGSVEPLGVVGTRYPAQNVYARHLSRSISIREPGGRELNTAYAHWGDGNPPIIGAYLLHAHEAHFRSYHTCNCGSDRSDHVDRAGLRGCRRRNRCRGGRGVSGKHSGGSGRLVDLLGSSAS